MYPGLATQVFSVFRCKTIEGIDGQVLAADFSVKCHETEHALYALIAGSCLGLYILGLPFSMFFVLYKNRRHLFDTASKEHSRVKASFGGLYLQYEEKYWWFEMVVIIQKMVMTGALCVIAPGSSIQLLCAVFVTLSYMLLVLKTAPYGEDSEDYSSFIACLTLTWTTVGGLLLIMDESSMYQPTYESHLLGMLLISMSICCIAAEIGIVILFNCGVYENKCRRQKDTTTKVLPVGEVDGTTSRVNIQELREIRLQYGAGSPEYIKAAQGVGSRVTDVQELREIRLQYGAGSPEYIKAAQSVK